MRRAALLAGLLAAAVAVGWRLLAQLDDAWDVPIDSDPTPVDLLADTAARLSALRAELAYRALLTPPHDFLPPPGGMA